MDTMLKRRALMRKQYTPPCSIAIFNDEELELLQERGCMMEALARGEVAPETPSEERFVAVARGRLGPETAAEKVWRKVVRRVELEHRPGFFKRMAWDDPAESLMARDAVDRMSPYHRGGR